MLLQNSLIISFLMCFCLQLASASSGGVDSSPKRSWISSYFLMCSSFIAQPPCLSITYIDAQIPDRIQG
jgi:hypothetical protein